MVLNYFFPFLFINSKDFDKDYGSVYLNNKYTKDGPDSKDLLVFKIFPKNTANKNIKYLVLLVDTSSSKLKVEEIFVYKNLTKL